MDMKRTAWLVALAGGMGACATASPHTPPHLVENEVRGLPPNDIPPTGKCRVWYPDTPAGQQPPPGECEELLASLPSGAWLLFRPDDRQRVIRVN